MFLSVKFSFPTESERKKSIGRGKAAYARALLNFGFTLGTVLRRISQRWVDERSKIDANVSRRSTAVVSPELMERLAFEKEALIQDEDEPENNGYIYWTIKKREFIGLMS
ncbi:hypothetical protein Trydic_g4005 [Trypoxylus dichotomus]